VLTSTLHYRLRRRFGTAWTAPLLTMAARRGLAAVAARLLASQVRLIGGAGRRGDGVVRLLLLTKAGFTEDMAAAFDADTNVRLLALDRTLTKAIYAAFLPPEVDDNNYHSAGPEYDGGKRALRAFWAALWPRLGAAIRIDAVLSGNFAYYAEREVQAVLEADGTPFIALHKENLKSEGRSAFFTDIYRTRRGRFQGRHILVYNAVERDVQIAAQVAAPEAMTVTGMPRLDRMHAWRRAAAPASVRVPEHRPRALFFSFTEKTGLPFLPRKKMAGVAGNTEILGDSRDVLAWSELTRSFHDAAAELARRAPDIDVVIKSKADRRALEALRRHVTAHGDMPANLSIISGGDPMTLIAGANAVSGFISTALFEALAAGKPVVSPRFAEATDPAMADYLIDMAAAVDYADTPEALIEAMAAHARARVTPAAELSDDSSALLERWTGNADGGAGRRVAEAVLGTVVTAAAARKAGS
jgi:hypothetical protein